MLFSLVVERVTLNLVVVDSIDIDSNLILQNYFLSERICFGKMGCAVIFAKKITPNSKEN